MIDPTAGRAVRGLLAAGNELEFIVRSGSMWPHLRPGDKVRVTGVASDRLRFGDIVFFEGRDRYVIHRVVAPSPRLRTAGDAALRLDPPVSAAQVLGRVVAWEHAGVWRNEPRYPLTLVFALASLLLVVLRRLYHYGRGRFEQPMRSQY